MTHARLGALARWICPDCFPKQRQGSCPCTQCTGYTGKRAKVLPDVLNAWGRPTNRVPS